LVTLAPIEYATPGAQRLVVKARVGAQQDRARRAGGADPGDQLVDEADDAALRVRLAGPKADV
jgi:hypothetical protein